MLDLNSIRWADLLHAQGSARNIPELLRDALPGGLDPESQLWQCLFQQDTVYSATIATFPYVVQSLSVSRQLNEMFFVGLVAAYVEEEMLRELDDDIVAAYRDAIEVAKPISATMSRSSELLDWQFMGVVVALAALDNHPQIARAIIAIASGVDFDCLLCQAEMTLSANPEETVVLGRDGRSSIQWEEPSNGDGVAALYASLSQLAEECGRQKFLHDLRTIMGKYVCPGCGQELTVLAAIREVI